MVYSNLRASYENHIEELAGTICAMSKNEGDLKNRINELEGRLEKLDFEAKLLAKRKDDRVSKLEADNTLLSKRIS